MRAKQSKFGKQSKPISKQILKTKQTPKRANFENKTEIQFQSSYAVYHKPSRSGRDGKPIPYKVMRYIQDGTFSIVLLVIIMCLLIWHCYPYVFVGFAVFSKFALLVGWALLRNLNLLQFCCVFQICSAALANLEKG